MVTPLWSGDSHRGHLVIHHSAEVRFLKTAGLWLTSRAATPTAPGAAATDSQLGALGGNFGAFARAPEMSEA